jgi:putative addiction module killer protein
MTIRTIAAFDKWLRALRDQRGRAKVLARIDRLSLGNPGDVKPVGDGVSEMRIDFGPGYRVYFLQRGDDIVLLLGGDKSTQQRNIKRAKELAGEARDEDKTIRRSGSS